MVNRSVTKISRYKGGRHSIYLPSKFVADSQFPFQPEDEVVVTIEGDSLIVKPKKR